MIQEVGFAADSPLEGEGFEPSVPANVIDSFEMERQRPDVATLGALQRAFEDVGVEFLPDDDVRVRAPTSPDK